MVTTSGLTVLELLTKEAYSSFRNKQSFDFSCQERTAFFRGSLKHVGLHLSWIPSDPMVRTELETSGVAEGPYEPLILVSLVLKEAELVLIQGQSALCGQLLHGLLKSSTSPDVQQRKNLAQYLQQRMINEGQTLFCSQLSTRLLSVPVKINGSQQNGFYVPEENTAHTFYKP